MEVESRETPFPVHSYAEFVKTYPRCPRYVRWSALNEEWAQRNHGQSLTRLAERGGLDPFEILANVNRRKLDFRRMPAAELYAAIEAIIPLEYKP